MLRILFACILFAMMASCNSNPASVTVTDVDSVKADTAKPKYGEMKKYWLVFLLRGNNRTQDTAASARIQKAHIANIERLADEGKIVMAGPMGYDRDLRGIFIMNCRDSMEAVNLVQTDSAIITGRLRFEVHPWWAAKGTYEFK
ncbi:MAG TPA: YciI family protein [Chitinophagaceae bacterium]|nr:YciI family protein [Chitinophagaceae bacterium]